MPGTLALCLNLFFPVSDTPVTLYFNAAICEFHRWPEQAVERFLDDNWEHLTVGFGLETAPVREKTEWRFVKWERAVEFWMEAERKIKEGEAKLKKVWKQ
jgi:hypothetical protein